MASGMTLPAAIQDLLDGRDLSEADMAAVMRRIMTGEATDAQIGGFLIALRGKGETVDEITAAARIMRELVTPVPVEAPHLVDTCGTGGDGSGTFNISTTCAFVAAAAGARVAKHGNRSVSSSSGSADVLEAAGVRLDLSAAQVAECIRRVGIGFMFAPQHHGAMRHAIGPRREMAVRTIFNLLGPLTNPAGAERQVLGVFADHWRRPLAEVLQRLGSRHVLVVHAEDGLDEISIAAPTQVAELKDGEIREYALRPADFGIEMRADLAAIRAADASASLALLEAVLAGEPGPARDIVMLNAGAAIYAAGLGDSLGAGVERAAEVIDNGEAAQRLAALVALSHELSVEAQG